MSPARSSDLVNAVQRPPVVIDAGPLIAMMEDTDRHHTACVRWLDSVPPQVELVIPVPVLTEVCHLVERARGAATEIAFVRSLSSGQRFRLARSIRPDLTRIADLMNKYEYLSLGFTDAVVVAAAERLGTSLVATVDRRHFSRLVPVHTQAFTLLPEQL